MASNNQPSRLGYQIDPNNPEIVKYSPGHLRSGDPATADLSGTLAPITMGIANHAQKKAWKEYVEKKEGNKESKKENTGSSGQK
ncbi:hypothetical protein LTR15_001359 [Elasticomyces elasticus]|nr:hypothetical protein LTR15_001359 [Elasticomyces elasticus]